MHKLVIVKYLGYRIPVWIAPGEKYKPAIRRAVSYILGVPLRGDFTYEVANGFH